MNCQTCRFEIEELGTDERLSDQAQEHLSGCPTCRAFYDERQALKRLVGGLEAVTAPPDFDFRLRARLAAAKQAGNHRSSWRSFVASAPAIALAASFALLVGGFVLYQQIKSGPAVISQTGDAAHLTSGPRSEKEIPTPISSPARSEAGPILSSPGMTGDKPAIRPPTQNARRQPADKPNLRRESRGPQVISQQGISNDFARRPAPVITPGAALPLSAQVNPVVELPVRSASQRMRVFVDDTGGARREITLEPVIFGSQDLVGRTASRIATSQGIW